MTQIYLSGLRDRNQDDADYFTEDAQRELRTLNDKLAKFAPDAICVEVPAQEQTVLDADYAAIPDCAFSDYETMRSDTSTYQNEIVQIGMRLGKTLGLDKIYAIDEELNLPMFDIPEKLQSAFNQHMQFLMDASSTSASLYDRIIATNTDEWSYHHHQLYIELNVVGAGKTHDGANALGEWYKRNLRIFANLQKLCQNYKRIFVVYGAGHLYILRELINACEYMELVDYRDYS